MDKIRDLIFDAKQELDMLWNHLTGMSNTTEVQVAKEKVDKATAKLDEAANQATSASVDTQPETPEVIVTAEKPKEYMNSPVEPGV